MFVYNCLNVLFVETLQVTYNLSIFFNFSFKCFNTKDTCGDVLITFVLSLSECPASHSLSLLLCCSNSVVINEVLLLLFMLMMMMPYQVLNLKGRYDSFVDMNKKRFLIFDFLDKSSFVIFFLFSVKNVNCNQFPVVSAT